MVLKAGTHLLADLYEVPDAILRDADGLAAAIADACRACGFTLLMAPRTFGFPGGGSTGFVCLSESHAAWHTWPERGYVALDVFTCGPVSPEAVLEHLAPRLRPGRVEVRLVDRGADPVRA